MVTQDKILLIYDMILQGKSLTTKELNANGFTANDINVLIKQNVVVRVKWGLYALKDVNLLVSYGCNLASQKKYDGAQLCFEKCYEMDKTNYYVNSQIFFSAIRNKNYAKALEVYQSLINDEKPINKANTQLYLYLLNQIIELPEDYCKIASNLTYDDIRIPYKDEKINNQICQNNIRKLLISFNFVNAFQQLREVLSSGTKIRINDVILRELLNQCLDAHLSYQLYTVECIQNRQYSKLISNLSTKKEKSILNKYDEYVLRLAKIIIQLKESSVFPQIKEGQIKNVFNAIDNNDYELALKLSCDFNKQNNFDDSKSAINLLLKDIVQLKKELSIEKKESEDKQSGLNNQNELFSQTVISLMNLLVNNKLDEAYRQIEYYLQTIEQEKYYFLIVDLIKISLLDKDKSFKKPLLALTLISQNKYSIDISNFIQEFYASIFEKRYSCARFYLEIISSSNKFINNGIMVDGLITLLDAVEKEAHHSELSVMQPVDNHQRLEKSVANTNIEKSNVKFENNKDKNSEKDTELIKKDQNFIAQKNAYLLQNKGIILLNPMSDDRIFHLMGIAKQYPNMRTFIIQTGRNKQLVLKYHEKNDKWIDVKGIIKEASEAYKNNRYEECINKNLQILHMYDMPSAATFSKIGLSYAKMRRRFLAIDYLTVAVDLAKKEGKDYDFSDIISWLKGEAISEKVKPKFSMRLEEFDNGDVNKFDGIDDFKKISEYIISSGLDVESACQQLSMSQEQIDMIKLYYARELYRLGEINRGNLFLQTVERSKGKTSKVKNLLSEIRKNRFFYQYRDSDTSPQQLVLSLISKKK